MSEIRVILNDYRSNSIGGILVGLEILRKAICPYLYNNSSCWIQPPKKALNLLKSLTHSFFWTLFQSEKENPLVMYYWDKKSLQTEEVIMKDKLLFLWHLSSLNDNSLAKEIYNLQKEDESFPSLLGECKSFLDELQIYFLLYILWGD